jgi:cell division protein FtsL
MPMTKAFALDNFWTTVFPKTKKINSARVSTSRSTRFWVAIILIAANVVVLTSYIYGVNEFASRGYQISSLENNLSDLTSQNKALNLQIAEATSMVSIQNDFLSANFVPAGTPKFITVSELAEVTPADTQLAGKRQFP